MSETKPLSEMSDEEIIAEIQALRERRAQARERRVPEAGDKTKMTKKAGEKVSNDLWAMLEGSPEETT